MKGKLRGEGREVDGDAVNRRKAHQLELASKRQANGLLRYSEDGGEENTSIREKQWKRFESYSRENQLPENVSNQKVKKSFLFDRSFR